MGLWHLKTISKQHFEADASEADDDSESTPDCQHDHFKKMSKHACSESS